MLALLLMVSILAAGIGYTVLTDNNNDQDNASSNGAGTGASAGSDAGAGSASVANINLTDGADIRTMSDAGALFAKDGDDTITGSNGDDFIRLGAGDDSLSGGAGSDTITGGTGNDTLFGGVGDDSLDGGFGSDSLVDGIGRNTLIGGGGADSLAALYEYNTGAGAANAGTLNGGSEGDVLVGDNGDVLTGGSGVDAFGVQVTKAAGAALLTENVVTVTDFTANETLQVLLTNADGSSADLTGASLQLVASGANTNVLVSFGGGPGTLVATLQNITPTQITAGSISLTN